MRQMSIEGRRWFETEEAWTEHVITNKLTGSRVVVKIPISALSLVDAFQVCRSFERLGSAARLGTEVSLLLTPLLGSHILVLSLSSRIYVSSHSFIHLSSVPNSFPPSKALERREFPCPLPCEFLVPSAVRLVDVRNLGHQRIVRVRIRQKRADRKQHLGNRQRWRPLFLENVQANRALAVHVWVVNLRLEVDLWRLERIVRREVNSDEE